jgi:hypothetical protein
MTRGLSRERPPAVSLEGAATADAARCPACGEPLFVWLEIHMTRVAPVGPPSHEGPREDEVVDRCENCGLAVPRNDVPSAEEAVDQLIAGASESEGGVTIRVPNASSLQAWLGAENWAALRPSEHAIKLTPHAAQLLLRGRGYEVGRARHLAAAGMASMWQTLLNLLTFHRDFAVEALAGRLRPGTGRGRAAYAVDVAVTVLAAVPTAILAVLLEGGAVLVRRGGVIELSARIKTG